MFKKEVFLLLFTGILAGIIFTIVFRKQPTEPKSELSEISKDFLPVYGYDRQLNHQQVNYYVKIPGDLPLQEKLRKLAEKLSRFSFGGRELLIKKIDRKDGKKIVVIDIKEEENFDPKDGSFDLYRKSWVGGTFQGSTGATVTGFTLIETFLQPDYRGEWIDGIEFLYNGKEITTWLSDHIDLSKSPYFENPFKAKN